MAGGVRYCDLIGATVGDAVEDAAGDAVAAAVAGADPGAGAALPSSPSTDNITPVCHAKYGL